MARIASIADSSPAMTTRSRSPCGTYAIERIRVRALLHRRRLLQAPGLAADLSGMRLLRHPNALTILLLCVATVGVFGPHLMMLGYKVAGVHPPAALTFFCLLSHGHSNHYAP
jgi:hypothetical protein